MQSDTIRSDGEDLIVFDPIWNYLISFRQSSEFYVSDDIGFYDRILLVIVLSKQNRLHQNVPVSSIEFYHLCYRESDQNQLSVIFRYKTKILRLIVSVIW